MRDGTVLPKKYKVQKELRKTYQGIEKIIPKGVVVEAVQEIIHYERRTHRVQVRYIKDGVPTIAWFDRKDLGVLR